MAEASSSAPDADEATYEQLADLELCLDNIDNRLVAIQNLLSVPIYEKRSAVIRNIPNFWPLVLEQASPDIDQYIQPSDSAVFAACLKDLKVERFQLPPTLPADPYSPIGESDHQVEKWGEPRSLKFTFEFAPNEWFEDTVLEKKFWFRRAADGWIGRVSEPVRIHWKKGKDLTDGLLDAAVKLHAAESKAKAADGAAGAVGDGKGKLKLGELPEALALKQMLEHSAGNLSFFTWFGYRGRDISEQESKAAWATARKNQETGDEEDDDDEDLEDLMADLETEIFPDGEDLAVSLAEDLWPGAIRAFMEAQEDDDDDLSDAEFEDDEIMGTDDDEGVPIDIRSLVKDTQRGNGPPTKKRKT